METRCCVCTRRSNHTEDTADGDRNFAVIKDANTIYSSLTMAELDSILTCSRIRLGWSSRSQAAGMPEQQGMWNMFTNRQHAAQFLTLNLSGNCCPSKVAARDVREKLLDRGDYSYGVSPLFLLLCMSASRSRGRRMPRSGPRRRRRAERRSCATASARPAPPRRREAAPVGRARDAGSRFDGEPQTVLPVHARAGERAAATHWYLGAPPLSFMRPWRRRSFWCRRRMEGM